MIRREKRSAVDGAFVQIVRVARPAEAPNPDTAEYPIENISRGGLRFCGNGEYNIDERIQVTVRLASGERHSAMARICYREQDAPNRHSHYGVSFLDNFLEMAACL